MHRREHDVVIRHATAADAAALARLAQLDGAPAPTGAHLLAEVGGELWAALPLAGGRALADPFRPSAGAVELLRAWAGEPSSRMLGRWPVPRPIPTWRPRASAT